MGALLALLVSPFLVLFSALFALWDGFVVLKLWKWFIEPAFGTPISYTQAIGVALLVEFCAGGFKRDKENEESPSEGFGKAIAVAILRPAMFLTVGWLVVRFV